MELLVDIDEINNACLEKYYPFCGSSNFKRIFFSSRYLPLLEDYLEDNQIETYVHSAEDMEFYGIKLPEYDPFSSKKDDEFVISVITLNIIPHRDIRSYSDEIILDEYSNITVANLYRELCKSYNADKWYESIKQFTFKSKLVDVSAEEMVKLSTKSLEDLGKLKLRIQKALQDLAERKENSLIPPTFVRLYSLSPKSEDYSPLDLTAKSADEVLELLVNQPRTYSTICKFAEAGESHGIMLREFVDLNTDYEFRLFVFGNTLRAISQYKCYTENLFPDEQVRKQIYDAICKWFIAIDRYINYRDYVLDIVFIGNFSETNIRNFSETNIRNFSETKITIIEINSYGAGLLAGSGLYNWETDYDILHYSAKPDIRFLIE